jgi:signal transduction histidine kinase
MLVGLLAVPVTYHSIGRLQGVQSLQIVGVDLAVGFIAATRSRRMSVVAAVLALGAQIAAASYHTSMRIEFVSTVALVTLGIVTVWVIGHSVRQRREYTEARHAQAAVQAIQDERLRIARELHDMIAHSIGIIAIQAGVGSRVIETQPAEAREALRTIEATSRETLSGLRRTLVALRQTEPAAASGQAPLVPAPGLADIDRLAATTKDAGVRVDVRWGGKRRPLPADIELSAFRIVQEAVTNVVRHAGTGRCRVAIDYGEEELSVEVVDDGRGAGSGPGHGFGIVGMRERAGLLRGRFTAGPRPGGGFRVAATLPLLEPAGAAAKIP